MRGSRGSGSVCSVTPGIGRLAGQAQQVHVVAVRGQRGDEAGRRGLHAAVKDEGPRDDQDLHRGRAASARSTTGNSAARAEAKL